MEDLNKSEIVKTLINVFDEKLKKLTPPEPDIIVNRSTLKPQNWSEFVSNLNVTGTQKLLLQHCSIDVWDFPDIIFTLEKCQEPFLSEYSIDKIKHTLMNYYARHINLFIVFRNGKKGILETVAKFISLEKVLFGRYKGRCPFHEEMTPSFIVDSKNQTYTCLSCGANGNSDNFEKEYNLAKIANDILHARREYVLNEETIPAIKQKLKNLMRENDEKMEKILKFAEQVDLNNHLIKIMLGDPNPFVR